MEMIGFQNDGTNRAIVDKIGNGVQIMLNKALMKQLLHLRPRRGLGDLEVGPLGAFGESLLIFCSESTILTVVDNLCRRV